MKIWKNIMGYIDENACFCMGCVLWTVVLFLVMKSEFVITDTCFSIVTVMIVGRAYRKNKRNKELLNNYVELSDYLEKVRYELLGSDNKLVMAECFNLWLFESEELSKQYYYRVFGSLYEVYCVLGGESNNDIASALGELQGSVISECDLKRQVCRELSGLKWIILSAIPAMSLVRAWVVANMSEMEAYYRAPTGILVRYGIWTFALLVFMLFCRLEEIKSEDFI